MAYIGVQPTDTYLSIASQQITGNGGATYTLDYSVSDEESVAVFVNNVRQNVSTYTVSGTSLTLGGTISASDSCWVLFLGRTVGTKTPAVGSVTNDMLAGSIANSKLANSSITLNGSAVSLGGSASAGITEAHVYRLTTSFSGDVNPIVNVELADDARAGRIGTGVTESSGLYSFSQTGIYYVSATGVVYDSGTDDLQVNIECLLSTDSGSSYDKIFHAMTDLHHSAQSPFFGHGIIDISNTTTDRVKFKTDGNNGEVQGNTNENITYFTFIRLGDR